ncbi:MAG: hypothetical protein VX498_07310 [Myxococcota bacterium]|nr:hypothetical protein [Myxococcota bacterium]
MLYSDLGPLEQAVLQTVVRSEALGLPSDLDDLWHFLSYRTHRSNLESALRTGQPLRNWITASGPFYVLCDRAQSAVGVSAGRRRAEAAWEERSGLVRGLSKLPWVEAVGVVGALSWGYLPDIGDPIDLVVIAEGGRGDLARRALGLYRRARGKGASGLRVLEVLDADSLSLGPAVGIEALLWANLCPVVNEQAWEQFRLSNSWIGEQFPNLRPRSRSVPGPLSDRRLDGRLASLRRARVEASGAGGESLLQSGRRRRGLVARLEERALGRLSPGDDLGIGGTLPAGAAAGTSERLEAIATWSFEVEAAGSLPVTEEPTALSTVAPRPEAPPEEEPSEPTEAVPPEESSEEAAETRVDTGAERPGSSRRRGARLRPSRSQRAAASAETGQRGRGSGRSRSRGRGTQNIVLLVSMIGL